MSDFETLGHIIVFTLGQRQTSSASADSLPLTRKPESFVWARAGGWSAGLISALTLVNTLTSLT